MKVAFRVDASEQIGMGHLVRCLTLANALKRRGAQTLFVCRHPPAYVVDRFASGEHELVSLPAGARLQSEKPLAHSHWLGATIEEDAEATAKALMGQVWDWLVVDHYALDERWESRLRTCTSRILVIDDLADRRHDCDVLLDQNHYLNSEARYEGRVPASAAMLLGPKYALLRDEFVALRGGVRPRIGTVKRVLVSFGGIDKANTTRMALAAIGRDRSADFHLDVVIGAGHPDRAGIEAECRKLGATCHIQTSNMAELIAKADLGIGAGGTSTWERCSLGLPTLTFCVAENQRQLVNDCAVSGLIYTPDGSDLDVHKLARHFSALMENSRLRQMISECGMSVVDGRGVSRVLRAMGIGAASVRPATESDSQDLFAWRNDPSIRAVSRNKDLISFESHQTWLRGVLVNPDRVLLIGADGKGKPLGVVRFDSTGQEAEVSIYLVPGVKEPGSGTELLHAAENWLAAQRPGIKVLRASVLGENGRSHRLFEASGYKRDTTHYFKKV